ncbi:hypothetical protein EVAR_94795_1 [Eumeta japonica]|uniref:Uncharacterized protein n=1 Tax=Eumeta variegata TaxID=151549 RepID=A0A4C1UI58_EUMVA|nr:hypothetical protein EVAR_94795_1 [Eumeta japonica]
MMVLSAVAAKKTRKKHKGNLDETVRRPDDDVTSHTSFGLDDVVGDDGFVPSSPDHIGYLNGMNRGSTSELYAPAFPTAFDVTGDQGFSSYDHKSYNEIKPAASDDLFEIRNSTFVRTIPHHDSDFRDNRNNPQNNYKNQYSDTIKSEFGKRLPHKTRIQSSKNSSYNSFDQDSKSIDKQNVEQSQQPGVKSSTLYDSKDHKNIYEFNPNWFLNYNIMTTDALPTKYMKNASFPKLTDFMRNRFPNSFDSNYANKFESENYYDDKVYIENTTEDSFNNYVPKYKSRYNFSNDNFYFHSHNYEYRPITRPNYSNSKLYNKTGLSKLNENFNHGYSTINYSPDPTAWKGYFNNVHKKNSNTSKHLHVHPKKQHDSNFRENFSFPKHAIEEYTKYGSIGIGYSDFENENYNQASDHKKLQSAVGYYSLTTPRSSPESVNQEDALPFQKPIKYTKSYDSGKTVSTYWGNIFELSNSGSPFKQTFEDPKGYEDPENVIYTPKRPQRSKNTQKYVAESSNNWNVYNDHVPLKIGPARTVDEWNEEVSGRFKSEEDLLGLRNHDTSHPPYLPSFSLDSYAGNFQDYKPIGGHKEEVEDSRKPRVRSKRPKHFEREKSSSEHHPVHVPIPKPYRVEVPHPIIVPVPEPYPVQVPVPRPVAVPVLQEVRVPIEKHVPYPVVKKVPYPIEKLVPVPIEKEVAVTVIKPYPVPVPHVRPVHHNSKLVYDEGDAYDDHDYDHEEYEPPRTHKGHRSRKKTVFKIKKPKSSRGYRRHRSSPHSTALNLEDRDQGRWPAQKSSASKSHYCVNFYTVHHKFGLAVRWFGGGSGVKSFTLGPSILTTMKLTNDQIKPLAPYLGGQVKSSIPDIIIALVTQAFNSP